MVRVMFVDDEPQILSGLRRMLRKDRSEWNPEFVTSGREAVTRMDEEPFDVLVTDMRMPEMSGLELLEAVKERHPETVRLVLSGHADQEMTLKAVGLAHQYLSKPCDPNVLRTAVQRSLRLRGQLADPGVKEAVSGMGALPTLPSIYPRVISALQDPNQTLRRVGGIIAEDIGLTAKVLQVVNSSFFGLARSISTPQGPPRRGDRHLPGPRRQALRRFDFPAARHRADVDRGGNHRLPRPDHCCPSRPRPSRR